MKNQMLNVHHALFVGLVLITFASNASAGKPERDKIEELKPKAEAAQGTIKSTCGCDVRLGVKWDSFATADDMKRIDQTLESLTSATKTQCDKEADKKAFCDALTDIEISFQHNESSVKMDGKKLIATTGANNYSTEGMISEVLKTF